MWAARQPDSFMKQLAFEWLVLVLELCRYLDYACFSMAM